MQAVFEKYGALKGASYIERYKSGEVKECTFNREVKLETPYGVLIPQYENSGVRRKFTKSVSFYKSGNLKSICLQEQTRIKTPIGEFPAELVTFYENGAIKRLFPLNGKITGYWTEENEYELAEEFEFSFQFGCFRKKVIAIQFYEGGEVKGLTFWPQDPVNIQTPCGEAETRTGIALYPCGRLMSVEPPKPIGIRTPIGEISAFNTQAIGIHSDANSLVFYESGEIKSLCTSTDMITVEDGKGRKAVFAPGFRQSMFQVEKMNVVPLQINFCDGKVWFDDDKENTFVIAENNFIIKHFYEILGEGCGDCSSCDACGV